VKARAALLAIALAGCSRKELTLVADSAAGVGSATAAPPAPPDVALLYWSDLRGRVEPPRGVAGALGGLPRWATLVDEARSAARAVVIVDAGDFLPPESDAGTGAAADVRVLLASYKRMGVNFVTPGENELALGVGRMRKLLHDANVTAVAANLVTSKGEPAFEEAQIVEAGGSSMGVFGVVELGAESSAGLKRWGFASTDAVDAARAATTSLRERGAAVIVGLFHLAGGMARADEIVRQAGDIDVVVLGHGSDAEASSSRVVGKTQIVFAGALGTHVGRIDLRLGNDAGPPSLEDHTLALGPSLRDHLGVSLLAQTEAERARIAQEKVLAAERRKKGQKEPVLFESWTYGSNAACALCHPPAVAQWKTTDHAQAMAALKKARHEEDPACLGCHTTGYLQPGGTQRIDTAVQQFGDVGCECCHGPSAEHVRSIDKKRGTSRKVKPTVCFGCHTPDQSVDAFDYAAALPWVLGPGHGEVAR